MRGFGTVVETEGSFAGLAEEGEEIELVTVGVLAVGADQGCVFFARVVYDRGWEFCVGEGHGASLWCRCEGGDVVRVAALMACCSSLGAFELLKFRDEFQKRNKREKR